MPTSALIYQGYPSHQLLAAACQATPQAMIVLLVKAAPNGQEQQEGYLKKAASTLAPHHANTIKPHDSGLPTTLHILPETLSHQLSAQGFAPLSWQNLAPITQSSPKPLPWLMAPSPRPISRVLVVGAGIAGAATAYALAQRGIAVLLAEAKRPAQAASGNRQGLLYAKVAAHNTAQTELLFSAYGYSRRLLAATLSKDYWGNTGVLHLNYNQKETKRNQALTTKYPQHPLFRWLDADEAQALAGTFLNDQSGLFWQQGAWLDPRAWVAALIASPLIACHSQSEVIALEPQGNEWKATLASPKGYLKESVSHIVLCQGAKLPLLLPHYPLHFIRGQTTQARRLSHSQPLHIALSGEGYVAPAYHGSHTFGASFLPQCSDSSHRESEDVSNRQLLAMLAPDLAASLGENEPAHSAIRCDTYDHLPVVGAVGDMAAMFQAYATLANDKNLPQAMPCPYLPGVYLNTAHSSRGLSTAPLAGEMIAAAIVNEASPLPQHLAVALHPNRAIIRMIIRSKQKAT